MAFASLKSSLNDWLKKRNLEQFFKKDGILKGANRYFRKSKIPPLPKNNNRKKIDLL